MTLAGLVASWRSRASRWLSIVRLLPRAGAWALGWSLLTNLVLGVLPVGFVVATSMMISALPRAHAPNGSWRAVLEAFAIAIGSLVLQNALGPAQNALGELVTRRVDGHCIQWLMASSMEQARLDLLDQPAVLDRLSHAYEGLLGHWQTPGAACAGLLALIARYAQIAGAVCLAGVVLGPLPALVLAFTALVLRGVSRAALTHWSLIIQEKLARLRRRMRYVFDTGSDVAIAKEARTLGLLPWLHSRAQRDNSEFLTRQWRERRRIYFLPFLGITAVMLVGTLAVMFGFSRAAAHGLSVLDLSLAAQAILIPLRMGTFYPESDLQTLDGMASYDSVAGLVRSFTGSIPRGTGSAPAPRPRSAIRFEGVRFRYPDTSREILSGLDLELPVGKSTAIVGFNGAGKTTLVRLLARLHEPTRGRITVDGTDLRNFDPAAWRQHLALIFQDYVRYELDVAANVGFGAPAHMGDAGALGEAMDSASAAEFVSALPAGTATTLSSRYPGGVELSGGQWQRIALARAFFAVRAGASVLVLDEPTAQLDIRAEAAFFDRFLELTQGLTTVIISHRFSTVRLADSIAVLADGKVAELGSHEELLRDGGRYAWLFRLQAQRFAASGPEAGE